MVCEPSLRGKTASRKWWAFALAPAFSIAAAGTQVRAAEPTFADFPTVIYCEFSGISKAYYFSQLDADGVAVYMTPDRQVGVISIEGVAETIDSDQSGTCRGKTLDDLRAAGQAFDLPR